MFWNSRTIVRIMFQIQTIGAHTLKAWLGNAVLVDGTARNVWDVDRNDILVPEVKSDRLDSPVPM